MKRGKKKPDLAVELRAIRELLEMDYVDEPGELAEDIMPPIVASAIRRAAKARPRPAPVHELPPNAWPAPPLPPLGPLVRLPLGDRDDPVDFRCSRHA